MGNFKAARASVELYNGKDKFVHIKSPFGNLTHWNTLYIDTAKNNYTIVNKLSSEPIVGGSGGDTDNSDDTDDTDDTEYSGDDNDY